MIISSVLLVLLPQRSRESRGGGEEEDGNRGYAEVPVLIGHIYRTDTWSKQTMGLLSRR